MTAAATPPEDAPHWARPLYERLIAMTGQLAEGGLEMAMDVKDRALAREVGVEPAVLEGLSRAYARLARATRLSLMLQERLIKDLIAFDKAPDAGRDDRAGRMERIVRVIVDPHADIEERLVREAAERLDRETLEDISRPVSELAATIAHDLGRDSDGSRLPGETQARAVAAGEDVGWPMAGLAPGRRPETSQNEDHEERHKGHKAFATFVPP